MFASSQSLHTGSVCWWVLLPFEQCLLAEVSVCLSQGSGLSLVPTPFLFWGSWLWAHPAVFRADAADVAGPQLCLLPREGEEAAICSPIMAAKCQGEGLREVGLGPGQPQQDVREGT